jgi:hypothetical protein
MIAVDLVAQEFFQWWVLMVLICLSSFFVFIDEEQHSQVLIVKAR